MTLTKLGGYALLILAHVVLQSRDAHAQRSPAAEIAHSLRTKGDDGRALPILTQARGRQPQFVLDEIADTLAAIAIGLPGYTVQSVRARSNAVTSLYLAGMGEAGLPGAAHGVPYAGTSERLKRVSESSHDIGVRGTALQSLSDLNQTSQFLPYLRQVAVSNSRIAYIAVKILVKSRGPAGRDIAQDLYKSGVVKEERALFVLQGAAATYGW
jgi:hypothetical protein